MKRLTEKELRSSKGIGASDVAAILHLDPWKSAFQLWQIKTGRAPRPPRTPAMEYGAAMEETGFLEYVKYVGLPPGDFERQVIAQHEGLPFLRAIADAWSDENKIGVEIKCPSSDKLPKQMARGEVPPNYLLQCMAMMDIWGVESWDFFVYRDGRAEYMMVQEGDPFPLTDDTLGVFWTNIAKPAIVDFWARVQRDEWHNGDIIVPPAEEWANLIAVRERANEEIAGLEEQKFLADAQIKQLMRGALAASAAGWKALWIRTKPGYTLTVQAESAEALRTIEAALAPLHNAAGVIEIKSSAKPENFWLKVEKLPDV